MRSSVSFAVLLLSSCLVRAQPGPGDWLLADRGTSFTGGSLFYMVPSSGAVTTLVGPRATDPFEWVLMAANNRDLWVLFAGAPNGLVEVSRSGSVTTRARFGGGVPHGGELEHDGTLVVSTDDGSVWRVDPATVTAMLLFTTLPTRAGITIDRHTADDLLPLSGTPGLLIPPHP